MLLEAREQNLFGEGRDDMRLSKPAPSTVCINQLLCEPVWVLELYRPSLL